MKKLYIYLPLFLLVAVGCSTAQKSSEVQSIKVSVAPYLKMDCKELATEQSSLFRDAQALGRNGGSYGYELKYSCKENL